MWNLTSFRLETLLVSVQDRCMVCARRSIGLEIDWTHPTVPLGDVAQVEAHFGPLEIVLILTQDSCTVCVERAIGSEIIWTHPMELLGDMGHVESHFFLF